LSGGVGIKEMAENIVMVRIVTPKIVVMRMLFLDILKGKYITVSNNPAKTFSTIIYTSTLLHHSVLKLFTGLAMAALIA
jgi:hypothetical protein